MRAKSPPQSANRPARRVSLSIVTALATSMPPGATVALKGLQRWIVAKFSGQRGGQRGASSTPLLGWRKSWHRATQLQGRKRARKSNRRQHTPPGRRLAVPSNRPLKRVLVVSLGRTVRAGFVATAAARVHAAPFLA